jgi:anti-anti-sigma factor
MGPERLVVEFERGVEGRVRLSLRGKLDEATAPMLDGVLLALMAESTPVLLDLSGIEHIDRRGLELLLASEADAGRTGGSVEVTGVPESLRGRRPPAVE